MMTSKSCCFIQDKIVNIYKHYKRLEVSRAVLLQRIWKKFVRNKGAREGDTPLPRALPFLEPFTSKAS